MNKKSTVYGVVVNGICHSNRMQFRVHDVENGIYAIDMTKDDFKSHLEPADIDDAARFFRKKSRIKVVRGVSFHDGIIPENPISFKQIPIKVEDATYDEFEELEAVILKNGTCYFIRTVSTEKAFPLMDVKEVFDDDGGNIEGIKGVTPDIRVMFTFHVVERAERKRQEEIERHRREMSLPVNAIRHALEQSGAVVNNINRCNRGFEAIWTAHGHTINTLFDQRLRVIEAGFCVSGYDNTQSATSVANVLDDYVKQGDYIHKTRTV